MAWQSTLEQARSVRLGRNTVIGLVAGILVGLTLGLLIGWVWWPVEWQGAATTAAPGAAAAQQGTGGFTSAEAQAYYLGSVADAFAYGSAAGDATAASVAAQRLAVLGGDLRAAFRGAINFYSTQGGGAARINNLSTLALAVGIPLDDGASAGGGASAEQPAAGVTGAGVTGAGVQQADIATGTDGDGSGGSPNWLLTLLMALLLVAGGFAILWALKRRRTLVEAEAGGFAEEELVTSDASMMQVFERDTLNSVRPALTPASSVRSSIERPYALQEGGPHGFDSEEGDVYDEDEYSVEDETDVVFERQAGESASAVPVYDDILESDEDVGEWQESEEPAQSQDRPTPPPGFVTSVGAAPPFSGTRSSGQNDVRQPPTNAAPPPIVSTANRPAPAVSLKPPTPSRYERYMPVETYTATYYAGRADFDYTKNLQTPDGAGYIGEYGIGIPDKRGHLNNDMEKAITIDVYLFDKTDELQPVAVSRSLLSLYADDHKRSEFERERESTSLPPIVAQPNTNFQLEGRVLLLDCQIKQVEYTTEGFFRNVTIELILKRKS